MQAEGVDWSTNALKATIEGHLVKVRGWLFFDAEHRDQAENTAPENLGDWRATACEVHEGPGVHPRSLAAPTSVLAGWQLTPLPDRRTDQGAEAFKHKRGGI
jgi:hypothetical protein